MSTAFMDTAPVNTAPVNTPPASWTHELRRRGITVLPGSTSVPVELYGLLPDGRAVHFLCRGASVTLRLYAADSVALAVGIRETVRAELPVTGEVWLRATDVIGTATGRAVLLGEPVAEAVLDGRARFGWTSYEAGLLRGAAALPLFTELLDDVLDADLRAAV